ncbi:MAG TPA: ZIP family metal transporter [Gemmatimonadales bacterium]|nr:ZIP family metal transporter [Gemmatimonadales bacterium]
MSLLPLLLGVVAAVGNLLGAAVVVKRAPTGLRFIETMLAFGAGFMLAVVLVGVLPVLRFSGITTGITILAGYLAVHLAHHVVVPHFHFGEETHSISPAIGTSALIGLSIHSFFDGVAIASGLQANAALGLMLFLSVLLHKLPEGVTIASVVMAGGQPGAQAFRAALGLGAATVLGVVLTEVAAPLATHGLALAAGATLYVAASNLVPEFQNKRRMDLTFSFFGGALAVILLEMWK